MALIEFSAELIEWRGPAPFHFLRVPEAGSTRLRELAASVSYGWGMIPVGARVGEIAWTTSLWPKDGRYLLPVKDKARRALGASLGDVLAVALSVAGPDGVLDREDLVDLVRRIRGEEAADEDQEEAWLAEFAAAVPHPRAIDLVLFPEVELGDDVSAERIVDAALRP